MNAYAADKAELRQALMIAVSAVDYLEELLARAESISEADQRHAFERLLQRAIGSVEGSLKRVGVTVIDPKGEPIDVSLHEVVHVQENAGVTCDTVVSVIDRGYVHRATILRPARVSVGSGSPSASSDQPGDHP